MKGDPCINGGSLHAWVTTGLDVNAKQQLVRTRRCVWCHSEQEKRDDGRRHDWREAEPWVPPRLRDDVLDPDQ